jgi:hypothetical protein
MAMPLIFLPWAIACLLVGDRVRESLGYSPKAQFDGASLFLLLVALGPVWLWIGSPVLGRVQGLRWLLVWPQPSGTVDRAGMTLHLPSDRTLRASWVDVDRLRIRAGWFGVSGELVGRDGSVLMKVPEYFVS